MRRKSVQYEIRQQNEISRALGFLGRALCSCIWPKGSKRKTQGRLFLLFQNVFLVPFFDPLVLHFRLCSTSAVFPALVVFFGCA